MSWFLYILLCDQKTYYVGTTDVLKRRIQQHKLKKSKYTKQFSDVRLVYQESLSNYRLTVKRERQIKRWTIAKKKALVSGNFKLLRELSKSH
ncbi:MAG: GIY-YIG nuclease family protein [Patescibacteria group bacterium]|nr:GIY-YIG nuclease family protein [Patescibacteria group bacterium]